MRGFAGFEEKDDVAAAEDELILAIGAGDIEPMRFVAHGGGEDVVGEEHGVRGVMTAFLPV